MSAWLVFTTLGFYPATPGSLEHVIARPFVRRAMLALFNGSHLTVIADRLDDGERHPTARCPRPWMAGTSRCDVE